MEMTHHQIETLVAPWAVIGFTVDHVVWWRAHEALAKRCEALWEACGRPADFELREKRGFDSNMISWFVSPAATKALDEAGDDWREYLCGTVGAPPEDSQRVPLPFPSSA